MSKLDLKRTIGNEIEDKKAKLVLIDSDKKAYKENLDDALNDCKKRIQELRKENSRLRKQLFERLKSDEHIINEAFQRKPFDRTMFSKKTCSETLEILNYKVCGKVKQLNLLKYLTEIKCLKLQSVENEFKNLHFEATYVNDTLAGVNVEGQELRDLENRLDKATLKYGEAEQINKVYIQIVYKLQEEHLHYGNNLDTLEKEISQCKIDLCNLQVMKKDAELARDAAINELRIKEDMIYQEKKRREKELNYMKQIAEHNQGHSDKLDKRMPARDSNLLGEIHIPANINQTNEEEENKIKKFDECYKQIQDLSGVLSLHEAVLRFKNQNNTEIHLRKMIGDLEKQEIKLRKEKVKFTTKIYNDRYQSETTNFNIEDDITNYNNDIFEKESKNTNIKSKLSEVNVILALCKQSIEHINEILAAFHSISFTENIQKFNFKDFIIDLFIKCNDKATNLMDEINQIDNIAYYKKLCLPPVIETYNEFYSNVIKNISSNNTRINISHHLKSILDDDDHESGEEDNNVPNRYLLKKQAFQFVETKTKKITKKKKKNKEK